MKFASKAKRLAYNRERQATKALEEYFNEQEKEIRKRVEEAGGNWDEVGPELIFASRLATLINRFAHQLAQMGNPESVADHLRLLANKIEGDVKEVKPDDRMY